MSIFNIFKRKKQASREQLLEENRDDHKLLSDDDTLAYQGLLSNVHKNDDKQPVIYEARASDDKHKNEGEVESSLEMRMSDSDNSGYYRHKNEGKEYHTTDMAIASEKRDREFRDAYTEAEAKLKEKKNYFTAMAGMQLEREPHMIPDNVPLENSGLSIAPERFKDFGEVPGSDAKENLDNYGKDTDMTPMKFASNKSSKDILSMIRDADALSFTIKTQASSNNTDTKEEDNLSKLKAAKSFLVESLRIKDAQERMDIPEEIGMSEERLDRLVAQEQAEIEGQEEEETRTLLQEETSDEKIEAIDKRLRSILGEN